MSSIFPAAAGYSFEAGKAVDGFYLPDGVHEYTSIAITSSMHNPWWRVDLEKEHCVWAVNILNRASRCKISFCFLFQLATIFYIFHNISIQHVDRRNPQEKNTKQYIVSCSLLANLNFHDLPVSCETLARIEAIIDIIYSKYFKNSDSIIVYGSVHITKIVL